MVLASVLPPLWVPMYCTSDSSTYWPFLAFLVSSIHGHWCPQCMAKE